MIKNIPETKINNVNFILNKIVKNITLPVAIRLVQSTLKEWFPEKTTDELYEMILFKTPESLAFQRSDIYNIHIYLEGLETKVEITLGFLSIFGASSPLPTHYNERILEDAYDKRVLLDFLEMLNHRLKKLIYPVWEKQRYYVCFEEDLSDTFSKYILSIIGLYSQSQGIEHRLDLSKLLSFSGILSMHQKSAVSFLSILKYYFNHEDIYIEEGIISKAVFPEEQHFLLGEGNSILGEDTCMGNFILTRHLKYRIHFKNILWSQFMEFTVDGAKKQELTELIQLIQKTPLSNELMFTLTKGTIKTCILGESELYLGKNVWIGDVHKDQTLII